MDLQNQNPNIQPSMPTTEIPKSKGAIIAIIIIVVIVLLLLVGYYFYQSNNKTNMNTNQVPNTQNTETTGQNVVDNQPLPTNTENVVVTPPNETASTTPEISGMVSAVKNMKDIVSKKDVQAFLATQSIFYKSGSSNFAELKSTFDGKMASFVWQTFNDIFSSIDFSILEKDLASCRFTEGKEGYSFDQMAVCYTTLTMPKIADSANPLADGSTYDVKMMFARAKNVWYMFAPEISNFTAK